MSKSEINESDLTMDGKSKDVWADYLKEIKTHLPGVLSDNQVDCDKLKKLVGEKNVADQERYQFSWAGKSNAFSEIEKRTTKTLRPRREESVNFDETENIFIEGENLEVLKILQKSYYGEIKAIYIDPPYNTGNDFIYKDSYKRTQREEEEAAGNVDTEGKLKTGLVKNTKTGRYHSNWLNMMYPRLFLAKNLLREDGVIFVSIDDHEVHNLRMIMNEIFGENNSLTKSPTAFIWKRSGTTAGHFANAHEYILAYAKDKSELPYFELNDYGEDDVITHGALKKISSANPASEITFPKGVRYEGDSAVFEGEIGDSEKQILKDKMVFKDGELAEPVTIEAGWAMKDQLVSWLQGEEVEDSKGQKILEFYFNRNGILWYKKERETIHPKTILPKEEVGTTQTGSNEIEEIFGSKVFTDYPKPTSLLKYLFSFSTSEKDIILDFFAGSASSAHAVMEQNLEDGGNRKYINVQLPEEVDENSEAGDSGYETIAEIAKERIHRAIERLENDREGTLDFEIRDHDLGVKVFKLVSSNFHQWRYEDVEDLTELEEKLEQSVQSKKNGAKQEDLLFELMLKLGIDINEDVKKEENYYLLGERKYLICLEDRITEEIVNRMVKEEPSVVVCLEDSFNENDQLKANTALQLKERDIEFKVV